MSCYEDAQPNEKTNIIQLLEVFISALAKLNFFSRFPPQPENKIQIKLLVFQTFNQIEKLSTSSLMGCCCWQHCPAEHLISRSP